MLSKCSIGRRYYCGIMGCDRSTDMESQSNYLKIQKQESDGNSIGHKQIYNRINKNYTKRSIAAPPFPCLDNPKVEKCALLLFPRTYSFFSSSL